MLCKICQTESSHAFNGTILRKHTVKYYRCPKCQFLQTEPPYWLDEAYSSAISDLDLGPVNRAITGAWIVEGVILAGFDPNAKFIDWGGGYGVFTRLMRDNGYDYYWDDPHCQNLFAKQFVASDKDYFEMLTAFEVFEHLVQPMDEIRKMLERSRNILFTTMIAPSTLDASTQWWYLTPEHGQHISLYSVKSLQFIAAEFGLNLCTNGTTHHLFCERPFSSKEFATIVRDGTKARMLRRLRRRKLHSGSRLMSDFKAVTGWKL